MSNLRSCPFCGGEAESWEGKIAFGPVYGSRVQCKKCHANIEELHQEKEVAEEKWNRRV